MIQPATRLCSLVLVFVASVAVAPGASHANNGFRSGVFVVLQRCRDVRIGSVLARGISGGQAKRVNIGIALVRISRCCSRCCGQLPLPLLLWLPPAVADAALIQPASLPTDH